MPSVDVLGGAANSALATLRLKQELKNLRTIDKKNTADIHASIALGEKYDTESRANTIASELASYDLRLAEFLGMTPGSASSAAGLGILAAKKLVPRMGARTGGFWNRLFKRR